MKKLNKQLIEKIVIVAAPVFTLIMYLLPWICMYQEKYVFRGYTIEHPPFYTNYFSILSIEGHLFAKIIMWVSLIGILVVTTLYVMSFVLKEKEKQLLKIGNIILVASTGILFLTSLEQLSTKNNFTSWIEFMTIPFALLISYNVATLIYLYKKNK